MNTKHTPGPWDAGNGTWVTGPKAAAVVYWDGTPVRHIRITAGTEVVACVATYGELGPREEADASLIAAAPDLLDALHGLIRAGHSLTASSHEWNTAHAAIAKATGEAA